MKHQRFDQLVDAVNKCSSEKNAAYLHREVEVLVDGPSKNDPAAYSGRTDTFKLVNFTSSETLNPGDMVTVRITDTKTFSLDGERIE